MKIRNHSEEILCVLYVRVQDATNILISLSMNPSMGSVIVPMPDMIGHPGLPVLWILEACKIGLDWVVLVALN